MRKPSPPRGRLRAGTQRPAGEKPTWEIDARDFLASDERWSSSNDSARSVRVLLDCSSCMVQFEFHCIYAYSVRISDWAACS